MTTVLPGRRADERELDLTGVDVVELGLADHPSRSTFRHREQWMLRRADFVLAFPASDDPESGTQYVIDLARGLAVPSLVVPLKLRELPEDGESGETGRLGGSRP